MLHRLICLFILCIPSLAFAQRFATVDLNAVKASMPEAIEMQAAIDSTAQKYEAEFNNLREKFQKELTDFQALSADTPNSIKERRAQEIQELNQKMQQFVTTAQVELQEIQQSLSSAIDDRIHDAITIVARQGGFSLVLDSKQPLFIEAVDVTQSVIEALR